MECVILIGLPASGKSTFYRERFASTHEHVSKDLLKNNSRPERRQQDLIDAALSSGRSVVVDNTNATRESRAAIIAMAKDHGAVVHGYYFPAEPADALRRNRQRTGAGRVPDVAIFTIRKKLEAPLRDEGFDRLFEVTLDEKGKRFEVEERAG